MRSLAAASVLVSVVVGPSMVTFDVQVPTKAISACPPPWKTARIPSSAAPAQIDALDPRRHGKVTVHDEAASQHGLAVTGTHGLVHFEFEIADHDVEARGLDRYQAAVDGPVVEVLAERSRAERRSHEDRHQQGQGHRDASVDRESTS